MTNTTKTTLFRLLNKDLSIEDFEKWIYENNDKLETELPPTLHFDLTAFDYKQKDCLRQLYEKLIPYLDRNEYNIWRTKRLLINIIENKIDLVLATRKLRTLYFDTDEKLIPITLGIGYESEIGDYPTPDEYHEWNKKALKEKLQMVEAYRDNIIKDAGQFLDDLNKKEKTAGNNT